MDGSIIVAIKNTHLIKKTLLGILTFRVKHNSSENIPFSLFQHSEKYTSDAKTHF